MGDGLVCRHEKEVQGDGGQAAHPFPRIVVKYTADENGNINPLALPDPNVAYLLASDVAAFDV